MGRVLLIVFLCGVSARAGAGRQALAERAAAAASEHRGSYRTVRSQVPALGKLLDARVRELARRHPGFTEGELAALFGRDAVLGHFTWSASGVKSLANGVDDSPLRGIVRRRVSSEEDVVALGDHALSIWARAPADASVEERLAAVRAATPGFQWTTLARAAEAHPRLKQAIARVLLDGGAELEQADPERLPSARVAGFRPTPAMIREVLGRPDSPGRAAILEELRVVERDRGNHDQVLLPSDVDGADPALERVMEAVWSVTGKQALPLDAIDARLAEALARRGKRAPDRLDEHVARAVLTDLALDYRRDVLDGANSPLHFFRARSVQTGLSARWRRELPEVFPDPGPWKARLTPARLAIVEGMYHDLLAGKMTHAAFYHRSGVSRVQLRLLQLVLPERFAATEGTPKGVVNGHVSVELDAVRQAALGADYARDVLSGKQGKMAFAQAHGLAYNVFLRVAAADPERFPEPTEAQENEQARALARLRAVAAAVRRGLARDILLRREDFAAVASADRELVAAWGPIDEVELTRLAHRFPGELPPVPEQAARAAVLAEEIRALQAERDPTKVELLAALRRRHPMMNRSRLEDTLRRHPDLDRWGLVKSPREPDARRAAGWFAAHPGATNREAARALSRETPRFTKAYLEKLRSGFGTIFEAAGVAIARLPGGRDSRPMAKLWGLLVELSEPGTTNEDLGVLMNGLLEERGVAPYTSPRGAYLAYRRLGLATLRDERLGRLLPAIAEEYAQAAPRGTGRAQILAALLRDYPRLSPQLLGRFVRGIELSGRGRPPASPRYLGGWDRERALLGDPAREQELARASQYARIPLRLPLLDRLVGELEGRQPLRDANVLWVSHLLGSTFPLALALKQAGVRVARTVVVGTPYGTNEAVRDAMAGEGFDVRVPTLSVEAYRREVERALDQVAERQRQNHQNIVVLDDGGLVAELLHTLPKYADIRKYVRIVEQTTRGITVAEGLPLETPVVNVARSDSKREEATFIGRAVAEKVLQGLRRLGRDLEGREVTVMGYGAVGEALAAALVAAGARVTVVERNPVRAGEAEALGRRLPPGRLRVADKTTALRGASVVIGATGERSLELEDLRLLRHGTVVASASSKQVEIDMAGLGAVAERTLLPPLSPLVRLPTARYRLGTRTLTVLGDGWPVNFDGDVEDCAPEDIQLTRAAMLAGAIQAAGLFKPEPGLVALERDADLLSWYRAAKASRATETPIGDPSAWRDVLRAIPAQ